ncbi:MAG TPA: arginase family protein [Solirubrobacteraceae bacterium]|nr:arginase family protein [Solirubrobacteraceae bacterium]
MDGAVSALLCRTSDRGGAAAEGARELAGALAERLGVEARLVGTPGDPREGSYEQDLRDSHGCLLEAGGQLEDALSDGRFPVLLAGDCAICVSTLPTLARMRPDAHVVWLDAHADFNTPETTPSQYLGGMCLAGACGLWDTGFGTGIDPGSVIMCGVRDVDAGERVLLDTHGVGLAARPSQLGDLVQDLQVYVHLDLDVLDPGVLPGQLFPAPEGLSDAGLRALLAQIAEAADVIGVEITSFTAPQLARRFATIVEPLLPIPDKAGRA